MVNGILLDRSGTGDWPASIAIAGGPDGAEQAWVVYAGVSNRSVAAPRPLFGRLLTDLDGAHGPVVAPEVELAPAALGNARPDVAFERSGHDAPRAVVVWARATDNGEELVVARIETPPDEPAYLSAPVPLSTDDRATKSATLEAGADVLYAAMRGTSGRLQIAARRFDSPFDRWARGPLGPTVPHKASVAAVVAGGALLVGFESDTEAHTTSVHDVDLQSLDVGAASSTTTGLAQPALVSTPVGPLVVGIRIDDGLVVSRQLQDRDVGPDVVEIGPEGGGHHAWPNPIRDAVDGRLRFIVRGPPGPSAKSVTSVLAFERPVGP